MSKFKVGNKVGLNSSSYSLISKKGKITKVKSYGYYVKVKDLDDPDRGYLDLYFREHEVKLIKPKLTEKRIREIIQEENDSLAKKLECMDKALEIAKQVADITESLKGTKCAGTIIPPVKLNEPKEESKPKSGWYKNKTHKQWLTYYDFDNNNLYGFDTFGNWIEVDNMSVYNSSNDYLADPKEVEQRLIEEAKRRGFKEGVTFRSPDGIENQSVQDASVKPYMYNARNFSLACSELSGVIFCEGIWATIIQDTVTINGYQMKQDGDIISFGCAKFYVGKVRALYEKCNALTVHSVNITTSEGLVNVTIQELERIVKAIK